MSANLQDSASGLDALQIVMAALAANLSRPLSAPATQAAQTIGKRVPQIGETLSV